MMNLVSGRDMTLGKLSNHMLQFPNLENEAIVVAYVVGKT